MNALRINHRTTYRYRHPVALGPHRLMLRPRESRDLILVSSKITTKPEATMTWVQDVFGNAVATASFHATADTLSIDSTVELNLSAIPWPVFDLAASAISYPFRYADEEWADLGALTAQQYADPTGRLCNWVQAFVCSTPTDTLSLLKDLGMGISGWITYESREDEGTQTPIETLDRGRGSCRDFAVLFAEAARSLGFGTRIVSGYLFNSDGSAEGSSGAGSTHAWAEVYLPGAGWITFDPTNRSVGGFNLIPVAVARDIAQVVPVAGSFMGLADAFSDMAVEVTVTSVSQRGLTGTMLQAKASRPRAPTGLLTLRQTKAGEPISRRSTAQLHLLVRKYVGR